MLATLAHSTFPVGQFLALAGVAALVTLAAGGVVWGIVRFVMGWFR